MSMQEKLRQLYLLDSQVRGLRTRLDAGVNRLGKLKGKLDQLSRQRAEVADQLKQNQVTATGLEKQAQAADERVNSLREQMNNVKSNKEYSALLLEVNTLKLDKGKLEEEALKAMEKVEQLKAQLAEFDAKIAEQTKLVQGGEAEVAAARAEVGQQLDDLTAKRNAAEAELPADVRTTFNKLSDMHEGDAMAAVHEQSRRHMEYTCAGCYMVLPAERLNALMRRPDEIVTCPSCGRILYLEQELKASFVKS
jgi:predicted  nucleic acid-binding Zn-ribbon protein